MGCLQSRIRQRPVGIYHLLLYYPGTIGRISKDEECRHIPKGKANKKTTRSKNETGSFCILLNFNFHIGDLIILHEAGIHNEKLQKYETDDR